MILITYNPKRKGIRGFYIVVNVSRIGVKNSWMGLPPQIQYTKYGTPPTLPLLYGGSILYIP